MMRTLFFHQTDECVFQTGRNLMPFVRLAAKRRDRAFELGGVRATDVQRIAKLNRLLHARSSAKVIGQLREVGPLYLPSRQANARDYFIDRAVGEQFAFGNISKPLATFGLVHVMRCDEKGQALRTELMNFFPKVAPRFWIDTGSRLIEQQQFGPMNETSRKRESLFPSPGKLTRELLPAFRQPEFFDAFPHRLSAILHAIHARDEIEIFFNAQVLPETEPLRHVTDLALDRFAFSDHVVAKNFPASVIGPEQSAQHAQKRGLAAAVWSEETEDLAGTHRKIDMIHRGQLTKPLRHSTHLDDIFPVFHFDMNSTSTG